MHTLNAAMFLEDAAQRAGDKPFLLTGQQPVTFGQVEENARRAARMFTDLGIQPGERIAFLLGNSPTFMACYFGALKMGAVPVPLNPQSPGPEVAYYLTDSHAGAFVAAEPFLEAAQAGFQAAGTCQHFLFDNLPGSTACPPAAQRLAPLLSAASSDFTTAVTQPQDVAVVLYTSGTTGRPKGAMLSHANLHFFTELLARDQWELGPSDVILMTASASHIFGQTILLVACATTAALSLVGRIDIATLAANIQRDRVTYFAGVPMLANLLLHSPQVAAFDLSSLRKVMFGGATISSEVMAQFKARFQVEVITGYGMTEAVPLIFANAALMRSAPPGSVGKPVWGTSLRIVDETDTDMPPGSAGEIIVRGPQVFSGYQNRPEANAEALRGGWFHTGDAGYLDANGYLFIVDRLREMVKVSGFSVFPAEVERVLQAHPAVAEVAVIGLQRKNLDERLKAFVVLKPGAEAGARELIAYCEAQLAEYKCPRLIEFRASLAKSPTGKIDKKSLAE
ncbi:MAG: AMP-binding protein [Anaerolineae bacterium]